MKGRGGNRKGGGEMEMGDGQKRECVRGKVTIVQPFMVCFTQNIYFK
jgi:hypothetical protein